MENVYEALMDTIDQQEAMLRLDHFSNQDGLDLGLFLVNEAKAQGITVSVAVRKATGAILFHHVMEGTCMNNQNWMRRKFNTVTLWERSSLRAWAHERSCGETIETHGFSQTDYIQFGGGFPLRLKSGEFVGVLTISNLPHFNDHKFAVEGLAKYLGINPATVPVAVEP